MAIIIPSDLMCTPQKTNKILDCIRILGYGFVLLKAQQSSCHMCGVSSCYAWCKWCEVFHISSIVNRSCYEGF